MNPIDPALLASVRRGAYQTVRHAFGYSDLEWYADEEADGPTWQGEEVAAAMIQVLDEIAAALGVER